MSNTYMCSTCRLISHSKESDNGDFLYLLNPIVRHDVGKFLPGQTPGWLVASEGGNTIALDTNIDEFLKNEGISREIVNKIQNLRKESNFNVSDKIIIEMERNNLIEKAIFANIEYVKNETLAKELNFLDNLDSITKIQFDNFSLNVKIYKIN